MTSALVDGKMMLQRIARAMAQRGLLPDFSPAARSRTCWPSSGGS